MPVNSIRGFVQLAAGLGDLTRGRAVEAAQGLLALPGAGLGDRTTKVAGQVSALADDLLAAATSNREHLVDLVRAEVDNAVQRLGLASARDLARAQDQVAGLRAQVSELAAAADAATGRSTATGPAVVDPRDTVRQGSGPGLRVPDAARGQAPPTSAGTAPNPERQSAKPTARSVKGSVQTPAKKAARATATKAARTTATKAARTTATKPAPAAVTKRATSRAPKPAASSSGGASTKRTARQVTKGTATDSTANKAAKKAAKRAARKAPGSRPARATGRAATGPRDEA